VAAPSLTPAQRLTQVELEAGGVEGGAVVKTRGTGGAVPLDAQGADAEAVASAQTASEEGSGAGLSSVGVGAG